MDFSQVENDQLLQLIQAAMAEAVARGGAIAHAAKDVYFDAAEALKIEAEAAEKAAQKEVERKIKELQQKGEAKFRQQQQRQRQAEVKQLWKRKTAIVVALLEDPRFAVTKLLNITGQYRT